MKEAKLFATEFRNTICTLIRWSLYYPIPTILLEMYNDNLPDKAEGYMQPEGMPGIVGNIITGYVMF